MPTAELPAHVAATRAAVATAQDKNRHRIASQRRPGGKPKNFKIGDPVLLKPPKCGRVGSTIDPKRIVCRVVGTAKHFTVQYKLRCNAGVLQGSYAADYLSRAPPQSAAQLSFMGVEVEGVRVLSLSAAKHELHGVGVHCRCRGACGKHCACLKSGVLCGRHCGCKTSKGHNCGNY